MQPSSASRPGGPSYDPLKSSNRPNAPFNPAHDDDDDDDDIKSQADEKRWNLDDDD